MVVFGWIMMIALMLFGLEVLVVFAIPFVASEIKAMNYKIKKAIEDKKYDIDKRSEARKHRDEIKRQRDSELADRKLDTKLQKVDKQIEIYQKKLQLAKELKEATKVEKEVTLVKVVDSNKKKAKVKEEPKIEVEELIIPNEEIESIKSDK